MYIYIFLHLIHIYIRILYTWDVVHCHLYQRVHYMVNKYMSYEVALATVNSPVPGFPMAAISSLIFASSTTPQGFLISVWVKRPQMVFHHPVRRVVRGPSSPSPLVTLVITDFISSMSQPTPHPAASSQPLNDPLDFLRTWLSKKRRIEHSSIHPCTASGQKLCPLGTAMTRVWIKIASKTDPAICVFRMDFRSTPKRQKTASHPRPRWALASQGPNCKTVT